MYTYFSKMHFLGVSLPWPGKRRLQVRTSAAYVLYTDSVCIEVKKSHNDQVQCWTATCQKGVFNLIESDQTGGRSDLPGRWKAQPVCPRAQPT
jgi:hypothetical protein